MQSKNAEEPQKKWQKSKYSNLIRYVSSGIYYARFRVRGKLIWKSLDTDKISVAQLRLADLQKLERKNAARGRLAAKGQVTLGAALQAYRDKGFRPAEPRNKKEARALKPAALAYYKQRVAALLRTWPGLADMDVAKIKEGDCLTWATRARREMSPTTFNHTVGLLRNAFDFGIKAGARYDNPAKAIMKESELPKVLELPNPSEFEEFVTAIEGNGSGNLKHCANLVRFLAFGGFRKTEAANIKWADCDFEKLQLTVRGHPETGLKNRLPGEFRTVPMIPEMQALLQKLRAQNPDDGPDEPVMKVGECQKSMDRAALQIGMKHLSHHDLRHLFATRCIESGVDIPTVARWLGHRDGGALAMKVYGHLRDHHSAAMAQKVNFFSPPASGGAPGTSLGHEKSNQQPESKE